MPDTLKPLRDSVASVLDAVRTDTEQIRQRAQQNPSGTSTIICELVNSLQTKFDSIKEIISQIACPSDSELLLEPQRKTIENELRNSQERLKLFIEHAPAAIAMFDKEMRYMYYSRRWVTDYKLENVNITGKTHYEVFPEIPQRWKEDHKACLQGIPFHNDLDFFIRPDGSVDWLKYEVYPWYEQNGSVGGIVMFTEVITKQKQAQDELKESRARLNAFIESLPFDFWSCGTDGRYQMINSTCKRNWGDLIGKSPADLDLDEDIKKTWLSNNSRAISGEIIKGEINYTIAGRKYQLYNILAPVRVDHKIAGIVGVNIDITEIKKLEHQLSRSEARFRALVETTTDLIWEVDTSGRYTYVSPKIKDLLGYEPHEVIGKKPFDLISAEQTQKVRSTFETLMANRLSLNSYENVNIHKDGHEVILETSGIPIIDDNDNLLGYRGIDRDITDRVRVQKELAAAKDAAEQRAREAWRAKVILDAIMEHVPEGIIIASAPDVKIEMISKYAGVLADRPREELMADRYEDITLKWDVLDPQSDRVIEPEELPLVIAIKTGTVVEDRELVMERRDGKRLLILVTAGPLRDASGQIFGGIALFRDITERKQVQYKLENLKDDLERKNVELESILGVASHDLRSPLVNIKGFSEEIAGVVNNLHECVATCEMESPCRDRLKTATDSELPESLNYIQNSATTIEQVLNGLLRVARVGLASLNLKHIDMNAAISQIVSNVEFALKQASASIEIHDLPQCTADESQIIQVFANLIDNAIKYFDPSRPGKIKILGTTDKDISLYVIEDNGKGIPYKHQEKIFELFYRIDPGDIKGEGLGLTMVRRMVDRNNGKIWVDSEPGKGSRFYVALPK